MCSGQPTTDNRQPTKENKMGTRCLTILHDDNGQELAVLYNRLDGYTDAFGQSLADFLAGKKIKDGRTMCTLAMDIVAYFKDSDWKVSLHRAGTRDLDEEYTYYVRGNYGEETTIEVESGSDEEEFIGYATDYGCFYEE